MFLAGEVRVFWGVLFSSLEDEAGELTTGFVGADSIVRSSKSGGEDVCGSAPENRLVIPKPAVPATAATPKAMNNLVFPGFGDFEGFLTRLRTVAWGNFSRCCFADKLIVGTA